MYRPVWSAAILDELEYGRTKTLVGHGLDEASAERQAKSLIERMRAAFDDAEVQGWEGLDGTYGLPDPDDEHVLAAAVVAGAGAIVTHNDRDFPADKLPSGIQVLSPPAFTETTVALDPIRGRAAISAIVQRSGRKGPRWTEDEVLETLSIAMEWFVPSSSFGKQLDLLRGPRPGTQG
jgi:hypothetical protein